MQTLNISYIEISSQRWSYKYSEDNQLLFSFILSVRGGAIPIGQNVGSGGAFSRSPRDWRCRGQIPNPRSVSLYILRCIERPNQTALWAVLGLLLFAMVGNYCLELQKSHPADDKKGWTYPPWLFPQARGHQRSCPATAYRTSPAALSSPKWQYSTWRRMWHRRHDAIPGARAWVLWDWNYHQRPSSADGPESDCERTRCGENIWRWRIYQSGQWKSALRWVGRRRDGRLFPHSSKYCQLWCCVDFRSDEPFVRQEPLLPKRVCVVEQRRQAGHSGLV